MKGNYEDAARLSYENSIDLFEEAVILYNSSKYARAYSLCVLACEEFAKAFLCKCKSVGAIQADDLKFRKYISRHDFKLSHFSRIMASAYALAPYAKELLDDYEERGTGIR